MLKICFQLLHRNIPSGNIKISSTQTCSRTNTISQWCKCIHHHKSKRLRIIRSNNLPQIKCHKLKLKIPMDASYHWCDHQPNFATFVKNLTTLSHSKYSSPLFAHRKSSSKLRMLIDLRRINHSLKNDYNNSNFPISNMTYAPNHFVGKNLLIKLDCSQAYHCVQLADDLSVRLSAFNVRSRTYVYECLGQGLNKSVIGLSSFIRHYLDPCLAADLCTQFMNDIGNAVKNFDEMIPTLSKIFESVRKSGIKLSPNKCEIGTQRLNLLGNIITPTGVSPKQEKISNFPREKK